MPALGRQEVQEFEESLGYKARPVFKNKQPTKTHKAKQNKTKSMKKIIFILLEFC
jgi:hypothetical protein